ncbi:MAG: hypothetical protein HDT39_08820 [Lachnospiraceae bacterium]|nr:hypothetical protein [Lachnospiraceae bacterium]
MSNFQGLGVHNETTRRLKQALNGYSTEAVKAAIAQSTLNETQIKDILIHKGLQGEELQTTTTQLAQTASTNALAASQGTATVSTFGLKNAIRGLGVSIKSLAAAHPVLTGITIAMTAIFAAVKIYDAVTVSEKEMAEAHEKSKEALEKSKETYNDTISELQSLQDEFKKTSDRLNELNSKDSLSLVEQNELEQLKKTNSELERELNIKSAIAKQEMMDAADDAEKVITEDSESYGRNQRGNSIDAVNYYLDGIEETNSTLEEYYNKRKEIEDSYNNDPNQFMQDNEWRINESYIDGTLDFVKAASKKSSEIISELMESDDSLYDANGNVIKGKEYLVKELDELYAKYDKYLNSINSETESGKEVSPPISFTEAFNAFGFASAREKLLELASSGELTPETLSSTEEYKTLLDKTSLSADYCCKRINEMISAQAQLSNVTNGLSTITSLYKQAGKNGFVDIKDLTSLDDTWKNLSSYEEFVNIVGSGTHSMDEMQQAFNNLTGEYLEHVDALDKVNESNKDLYINQLKSAGISNAQSLVEEKLKNKYLSDISTYKGLAQANKELYVEKLKNKNISNAEETIQKVLTAQRIAQTNVLQDLTDANKEEKISALESQGITEANAIVTDKLKAKKEAEETVTNNLNMTMDEFNSKSYEVQDSLLNEAGASAVCREAIANLRLEQIELNANKLSVEENIASLVKLADSYGITGTMAQGAAKAMAQVREMQESDASVGIMFTLDQQYEMIADMRENLASYWATQPSAPPTKPSVSSGTDTDGNKEEAKKSKEILDFIESKINRLKTVISELGETASNTFKSLTERASAYENEISKVTEEIQLQKDAYNKYMEKANSVGLPEEWAAKVRDGSLDISEITDDTIKNQIKDYQSWYDKAQDCLNTVNDLEKELSQLNIDRLQLSIDKASRNLDKIKSKSEKIQNRIDDDTRRKRVSDYDKLDKSYNKEIENYKAQNELLRQQQQYVDKGSEEWEELEAKIRSNNDAIDELEKNIKDSKNLRIQIEIDRVTRNLDKTKAKSEKIQDKIDDDTRKTKTSDYNRLDKSYNKEIASYKEENRLLREKQKNVEKGSDAWNDYQDSIDENNKSIKELEKNIKKNKISRIQIKIDVKAGELDSLEKYGEKISDKIGLREASGQTVKASDYSKLNDNEGKQIKNLQAQNKYLKQQQKNVEKGSEAWKNYQDAIDSNNSSIRNLTKEMVENAKAMAALNNAKAEKKVEKADSSDELLDAKAANSISYKTKNSYVSSKNRNIDKRKKAYDDAVSANRKSFKKAGNAINGIKSNSKNKSILKKIKSYVKKGKAIPAELIQSAAKVDTKLAEKCAEYNAYLTELETSKTNAELYKYTSKQEKAEIAKEKLENIEKHYSDRQGTYKQRSTRLDSKIDLIQAKGYQVSTKYYDRLIANEKKNNASLVEERNRLTKSLDNSVKNGSIKKYSPEWYELRRQIDEVTNSIDESDKSLQEYKNHLRQIKWDNFEYLEGRISNIISESDFMINQLSRKDLTSDETGGLTDEGKAVASLHSANYKAYMKQSVDYKKQIDKINKDLAKDPYNKELLDHKEELIKLYQDSINAANDEKDSIIDLYTQGYDALKNKIAGVISEYEELLDAEKSAYDYQNTIADKTKQIASIKKQLAAYSNGTSEETKAKIQKLTVSLEEAEKDLKDTQYDRFISDTKDILGDLQDTLSNEIQNIIKNMRDNFSSLTNDIKSYSSDAADTITDAMENIGYVPTENFNTILNSSDFSKGMVQAINDTKDYHKKMLEYADKLQRSDGKEFLKETLEDAEQARAEKISDMKKDRDNKYEKMQKSKTAYETVKKIFGKNNVATKAAKTQYEKDKEEYKKSDKEYRETKEKSGYESVDVLRYLNKHLNVTKKSRDELSDLNRVFYDTFGQRILSDSEVEKLAKLLNVKSGQKENGSLYQTLKKMGIPGFKMGTRNMLYNGVAMLAEEGQEIQFDRSQGVLRTVGQGDMIFTNEMAENLWKLAQNNPIPFNTDGSNITPLPELKSNFNSGDVNINMGGIVMNGVNDPEEFSNELNRHLATNPKTIKILQNQSIGSLSKSYNSLGSRRYL